MGATLSCRSTESRVKDLLDSDETTWPSPVGGSCLSAVWLGVACQLPQGRLPALINDQESRQPTVSIVGLLRLRYTRVLRTALHGLNVTGLLPDKCGLVPR